MGAGGSQQVHDFNPGEENGLFWTIPLPPDSVDADFEDGRAEMNLRDFEIDDYHDVGTALSGGKEIATARLSLRISWRGITSRQTFVNPSPPSAFANSTPFALRMARTGATMRWSAVETLNGTTSRLVGHPSNTPDFAMIGRERNGVFFNRPRDDD
jgi:hypothetical protein